MKRVATALLILATLSYLYHAKSKDMVNLPEIKLLPHPETGELVPEIWTPVIGYEEKYKISNYSRVVSTFCGGRLLKPKVVGARSKKYLAVTFHKNGIGKRRRVHTVCFNSFFGYSDNPKLVVDHKDNDSLNNFIHNLQRITNRQNSIKDKKRKHGQLQGISRDNCGWFARVNFNGKDTYLGRAKTQEEAHAKYLEGIKRLGIESDCLNLNHES